MAPSLLGDLAATEKIARTLEQVRNFVERLEDQQSTMEFIEFPGMFG